MTAAAAQPQRTCIACRCEADKGELLRFVLGPDRVVVPDPALRLPGRGAYTCPDPQCILAAVQRRQFARTFKREVVTGKGDELLRQVRELVHSRLNSMLGLANKAGVVVSGSDSVERALTSDLSGGVLWIAADASVERREKFTYLGTRCGCMLHVGSTAAALGQLLGKEQRTFLLLRPAGITSKLAMELGRFRKIIDGGAQGL